jgi:hypothetical protein
MQFTIAAIISISALAAASPIVIRQDPQIPDTPYGVDPTKPFYLTASSADGTNSYTLQPFYIDYLGGILGLQAVLEGGTINATSPRANFTLTGNHYGTSLYAYDTAPCTSAESCDTSLIPWSNDSPAANSPLAFHMGVDEPSFGGLAFYGVYTGGDFEAGERNYLVGAQDSDLTKAFSVCDSETTKGIQLIAYHGTNSSCVAVTIEAVQTPGN